jgi:hypothetical protein
MNFKIVFSGGTASYIVFRGEFSAVHNTVMETVDSICDSAYVYSVEKDGSETFAGGVMYDIVENKILFSREYRERLNTSRN